ncbi:MAG: hypothetical protein BM564_00110 [Bacteroidetes bacterium MedPE-SWsnd-G2]|nr:MAG: hypothetical protein BM564_00110 [Bacteroidetes bacterium MedPE-SWsnd-G2]
MGQDIRKLLRDDLNATKGQMPEGHEARFLNKLDDVMPVKKTSNSKLWLNIAAAIVVLLAVAFGFYKFSMKSEVLPVNENTVVQVKSLGDISPDLKKVEDYYLANINLELSKVQITPENKELFDGYVLRLEELNKEYNQLFLELTENGPTAETIDALIDNLKIRLNLLYRLKEQLNTLNSSNQSQLL